MGAKRNAVTGLITQLIIIALGLIVPRIMITNYGSDTNGLTNTLTQIFNPYGTLTYIWNKNRSGMHED